MEGETIEHVWLTSPSIDGNGDHGKLEADLSPLIGVRNVMVFPDRHDVEVTFDPRVIDPDKIEEVMESDGYHVTDRRFASQRDAGASI